MKVQGKIAALGILGLMAVCIGAQLFAPADYATQFREAPNAAPSLKFPLGTDDLGRDRLSRMLYGGRVSLLLAPAAALLSTCLAAAVGTVAGYFGGITGRVIVGIIDLFLSLPWFFLLITVRAMLPLDVAPMISVTVTFTLLGLLGWAASARIIYAGVHALRTSGFITTARACGCARWRTLMVHIAPNLKSTLWAQFLISIPAFILAEANLTMLGLGVAEPLPSWGSLLKELENYDNLSAQPWRLAPLVLLMLVVWAFQAVLSHDEVMA
ncbi:MAG: ABC transporter permease [Acidobacteriales bacterium]|nr:ABC transporter permease [Terriglobales bacterium]